MLIVHRNGNVCSDPVLTSFPQSSGRQWLTSRVASKATYQELDLITIQRNEYAALVSTVHPREKRPLTGFSSKPAISSMLSGSHSSTVAFRQRISTS